MIVPAANFAMHINYGKCPLISSYENLSQKSNACSAILRKGTKRNLERSISKLIKMSHNGLVESPDQLQPNFVPYQI